MSFRKITSVLVSERVFDIVCEQLDVEASEYGVKIDGYLSTFNNCREQGFYLTVSSTDFTNEKMTRENIYVWVCESRNSDNIMVVVSNKYPSSNGMFDENAYNNRKTFRYDEYYKAADYIHDLVKKHFANEF